MALLQDRTAASPVEVSDRRYEGALSMKRYQDWLNHLNDHAAIMAQRFVELPIVNPTLFDTEMVRARMFKALPMITALSLMSPRSSLKTGELTKPFCSALSRTCHPYDQPYEVSSLTMQTTPSSPWTSKEPKSRRILGSWPDRKTMDKVAPEPESFDRLYY